MTVASALIFRPLAPTDGAAISRYSA